MTPQALKKTLAAQRASRLWPGKNVRMRRMPSGTVLSFRSAGATFEHPWLVSFDGTHAEVRPGMINGVMAEIDDTPLTDEPSPLLRVKKLRLDKDGRGWFATEIQCDPEKAWGIVKVKIVQVADPDTENGEPGEGFLAGGAKPLSDHRARHAIAMVRQREDGRVDVYQIAHFDLQHRVAFGTDKTPQRHFFFS